MAKGKSVNPRAGHSREWWNNRIAYLERKVCRSGKELQAVLTEIMEAHRGRLRDAIVNAVEKEFSNLVIATPQRLGRARAGWQMAPEVSEWTPPDIKPAKGQSGPLPEYLALIEKHLREARDLKLAEADVIYIMNNVEYILALEAGWSVQAPQGFIGVFINRLKTQISAAVKAL